MQQDQLSTRSPVFGAAGGMTSRTCWRLGTAFRSPWEYHTRCALGARAIASRISHGPNGPPQYNKHDAEFRHPGKKTCFVTFCAFLSYGATQQRRQGTTTRPVGESTPHNHRTPGVGYTQGHGRGWSCGHGRFIPMSVTRRLYSKGPWFSKDPPGGCYFKQLYK